MHAHTRTRTHTRTHRLSKSLKPVRGRKREDMITYTWKNRDGGERIDGEERAGAALLPLAWCFLPLESVVFQNRRIDFQIQVQWVSFSNLSAFLKHAEVICEDKQEWKQRRGDRGGLDVMTQPHAAVVKTLTLSPRIQVLYLQVFMGILRGDCNSGGIVASQIAPIRHETMRLFMHVMVYDDPSACQRTAWHLIQVKVF